MLEPVQDLRIVLQELADTETLARHLALLLTPGDLLILTGDLGAGKTTFTQALGEQLGITEPITSPTFVISRHHKHPHGGTDLVHVDAYRLETVDELASLDLESSMPDSVTVIEWGRNIAESLAGTNGYLDIELIRAPTQRTGEEPVFDFSEEDLDEPRTARVRAFGRRYLSTQLLPETLVNSTP